MSRRLLKLHALPPTALPAHASLASAQKGTSAELLPFVSTLLSEGSQLADSISTSFSPLKTAHLGPRKGGDVQVLAGGEAVNDASGNGGRGEFWIARRSAHELVPEGAEEAARRGEVSWAELRQATMGEFSVSMTPDVVASERVVDWKGELEGKSVEGWVNLGMVVYEQVHDLGFPLGHRAFANVVVTGQDYKSSFLVVQVPVHLSDVPTAMYSNGRHKSEGKTATQRKNVVLGLFASVERCRKKRKEKDGEGKGGAQGAGTEVAQWDMAFASDARGSLPMFVQKRAVPGVIAKDVTYLMDWAWKRRSGEEKEVGAEAVR